MQRKVLSFGFILIVFLFSPTAMVDAQSPNIILISIDSLRADHLGTYGYSKATSPNIDSLADDGVVFTNTISTTTWTLTAHISMLTGLYPEVHKVIHDGNRLSEKAIVCSEILKEAGYLTAGFVSGPYLSSKFGYNQGFDLYDDYTIHFSSNQESHKGITSPMLHRRAIEWLEQNYHDPFFLFVHYWDVHYDYDPPPPFDTMFDPDYKGNITARRYERNKRINPEMPQRDLEHIIALYDGEIAFTDSYIGKLMEWLKQQGIYENTLIILTADHGDEFFEHGGKGHRRNLFDETLKVPLIIKFPSSEWKGMCLDNQVSIIDIVPTFLHYLGIDFFNDIQGKSLIPLLIGDDENYEPYRFADLHGHIKCVRTNPAKYIVHKQVRRKRRRKVNWRRLFGVDDNKKNKRPMQRQHVLLFDLQEDAAEQHNIAKSNPELTARMHRIFMNWLNKAKVLADNFERGEFQYDEDLKRQLKDLGYIQ
ncbi:MAG: sulfatase [Deltaproteobacteria bacterium]|nr:sulfatase [Deltaproteobacteria bacterium]